jgi:hypothetical protein
MAAAEIEAKITGVQTYKELRDTGFFEDNPFDVDPDRLDLADFEKDAQKYKRSVFKMYLSRYRGTKTAKYPDFASNDALDRHIEAQENYFAARRNLSKIENEIRKKGFEPNDTRNLPPDLKSKLIDAREKNRNANKQVKKTEPSRP